MRSNEEMLAKLLPSKGKYDLIHPSEYVVEALIKRDKLEPLDMCEDSQLQEHRVGVQGLPMTRRTNTAFPR